MKKKVNWESLVDRCVESELSQSEFCRREKIALSSFQYQKALLKRNPGERFVEVPPRVSGTIELVASSGVVVRLPLDTPCERVSELAQCLG